MFNFLIHWNVKPEIFTVGFLSVRWYGLMFVLGFFLGLLYMQKVAERENKNPQWLDQLLLYIILGTTIGARLGHTLFYEPMYYFSHPLEVLMIWRGGLASHGGTLGVILAVYLFSRKHQDFHFLWILDRISVPTALTASFIRIGNLMNSEILGKPTDGTWGFIFQHVDQIPRHPTQIYESFSYFFISIVGYFFYRKWGEKTPHGFLFGLTVGWIFLSRIFLEIFKENQVQWESSLPMNMGQLLSIPLIIACFAIFVNSLRKLPN